MKTFEKIIFWLFCALLFFVPLILWPFTSEVFEFNKIVLVYILTCLITTTWITQMIIRKRIIFRRTILDIPLLLFLASQTISTVFSIDPLTSFLGYYSRFNGGLVSLICYALLYWAFVSNLNKKQTLRTLYSALISALIVSIYGILEHFGIDKNVWQQDVQTRVFSTLGQPNWLAAWVVALMPITWAIILNNKLQVPSSKQITKFKSQIKAIIPFLLSILFFTVLLFTGSRSGLLGFVFALIIFWGLTVWKFKKQILRPFLILNSSFLILAILIGTQWTPGIDDLFNKSTSKQITNIGGTALETGGTESGSIRKIVWKGAFQIWLHYPVFGTGVETFAYSYYLYRPAEHNATSEWDFIYNKAHNEYLNFLANTGIVGLLSYLVLIGFSIYHMTKISNKYQSQINTNVQSEKLGIENLELVIIGLLAGYISILITNFFGFSVVPIQLEFFLFPAIAIAIAVPSTEYTVLCKKKLESNQKTAIFFVLCTMLYVLVVIGKYWRADYFYNLGRSYNAAGKPDFATKYLTKSVDLQPKQPLYYSELANSYVNLALAIDQQKEATQVAKLTNAAITEIDKSIALSPANVNYKRVQFGVFVMLASLNPNYLINARETIISAIAQAPTDAKLYYNLGLIYARIGQPELARQTLARTIELKPNYRDARLAYALLLIDNKQNPEAKTQLEYILSNISPTDSLTKQTLESVK